MKAEFVNMKEIEKNLLNSVNVMSKTVTEGLAEVGERGVEILKRNTPVDSGRLRNSMSYTIANRIHAPLGGRAEDTVNAHASKEEVIIGTNVIYGPHVEYMSKNGSQGFMARSYRTLRGIAKKVLDEAIRREFR